MSFELNTNDVYEGYGLLPKGEYEVTVEDAKEDMTQGGKEHVAINLRVREDVEQKYQRKIIFVKIWKLRDTGKYNPKQFNTIGRALGMQNGKKYNSLKDLLDDFIGLHTRVTIGHQTYNEQTREVVNKWDFTKYPKDRTLNVGYKELQNDDVPF